MLLNSITLNQYGVYGGKNTFDLSTNDGKPIVIIGGENGAGKTTLFESIKLCLYGIRSIGNRITKKTYEKYLDKKVHRVSNHLVKNQNSTHVSLQFMISKFGIIKKYEITRSWTAGGKDELLQIKQKKSNKWTPLDLDEAYWQSYIDELIPIGITDLFFFDGERIVNMAKDGETAIVKSSFESLLGLDMVEQLRTDLHRNLLRESGNNIHLNEDMKKITDEKSETEENIKRLLTKRAEKINEVDALEKNVVDLENKISNMGGGFAQNRSELKNSEEKLLKEKNNLSLSITELCNGTLPFSLIPKQLIELNIQIDTDSQIAMQELGCDAVQKAYARTSKALKTKGFWKDLDIPNPTMRDTITSKILTILNPEDTIEIEKSMLNLARIQEEKIRAIIYDAEHACLDTIRKLGQNLSRTVIELDKVQNAIANAPADDELGPLITSLGESKKALGTLESEIEHIDQEVAAAKAIQKRMSSKIKDIMLRIYNEKKADTRVALTKKIQDVLEIYSKDLRIRKVTLLEKHLIDGLHVIMHKQNFIEKITMNESTYEISLFRKDGMLIDKDMLSEGEKQMYVTALLWALAKTSGRPLPFIIDTPLARLDIGHRLNLIDKFFPIASHQTIILSTDSEVSQDAYRELIPHVSRSYLIEYMPEDGDTRIHDGYFKENKVAV